MKPFLAPFPCLPCILVLAAIAAAVPVTARADDRGNILREEAVTGNPGKRSKTAPNAMRRISKLADTANRAARDARDARDPLPEKPPVSRQGDPAGSVQAQTAPASLKTMLLPTADAAPQKTAATSSAADSPPVPAPDMSPLPPATPAPAPPVQIKPIPMPGVPQNPASPAIPKLPSYPVIPQAQKQPLDAAAASRRGSATQPFILPAPAPSARNAANSRHAPAQQPALFPESGEVWGYFGTTGPEFWGRMRPEWKLCAEGKRQSPIDFKASRPVAVDLDPVKFDYRPANFVINNSSRQLRIRVTESMSMEVRGQRYVLEGFTLHRPGETRIDNRIADMEAHFFHRDGKGRIAVLAVQFARGNEPNASLQTLLNNLPLERGDSYTPRTTLDVGALLPASPSHYLYMGSLTTPPCTEGVLWVVMKEAMTLSDEQYEVFSRLHASNARPPQPANERLILESN